MVTDLDAALVATVLKALANFIAQQISKKELILELTRTVKKLEKFQ